MKKCLGKSGIRHSRRQKNIFSNIANERAEKPEHRELLDKYYNSNGLSAEYVPNSMECS
jgi:hypothetical protein